MSDHPYYDSEDGRKLETSMPKEIFEAHKHSINHREEIEASKLCGCFACLNIFEPTKIWEWIESVNDEFATCPYCGIDAVIGDKSGFLVTRDFLDIMNKHWFEGDKFAKLQT